MHDFKGFYNRYGRKIWLFGILGVIALLMVGSLVFPEIFWDKFLYRYYWGPLEIDATESGPVVQPDGYIVDQGYTLVSEITYGIVLILALFGIYRLFEGFKIRIDEKFVLSIAPFFFLGGTLRVLEDAELYKEPISYFFISPVIYFVISAVILTAILWSKFLENKKDLSPNRVLIPISLMWIIFDIVYIIIYLIYPDSMNYLVHWLVPLVMSIGMILVLNYHTRSNGFDPYFALFLYGMFLLAFSVFTIMLWPEIEVWRETYLDASGRDGVTTQAAGGALVILLSAGITFGTYVTARVLKKKYPVLKIYTNPVNLFIIFGQMFDAVATYVGVDLYNYSEKHPIPDFFFQTFGTSLFFLPIKLALGIAVVYLIDVSFKEDLVEYPNFKGLIKIIIIVLGLGPGTRDVLRLVMGV